MWEINEQGLPGTGKVSPDEISHLMNISEICLGAFENDSLIGFVLCLLPKRNYKSLNYSWFNERYEDFIYVDRIAIAKEHRNKGIGTQLYQSVIEFSNEKQIPIAAEVSLDPPNLGSDRFHVRHSFSSVGEFHQEKKSVTMYIRDYHK
jgi:predicted GNAT superfamily acetyltransferase